MLERWTAEEFIVRLSANNWMDVMYRQNRNTFNSCMGEKAEGCKKGVKKPNQNEKNQPHKNTQKTPKHTTSALTSKVIMWQSRSYWDSEKSKPLIEILKTFLVSEEDRNGKKNIKLYFSGFKSAKVQVQAELPGEWMI